MVGGELVPEEASTWSHVQLDCTTTDSDWSARACGCNCLLEKGERERGEIPQQATANAALD